MRDLNGFMYFVKVVEHGGFTQASRQLGIPKSTMSRRVTDLETQLGVQLLQRSTRRVALTAAGDNLYERCKPMVELADSAHEWANTIAKLPEGDLRVSCPITLAQLWLTPIIPDFLKEYPNVNLKLVVTNRHVDLIEERMDITLRVRQLPLPDSQQITRRMGQANDILVASGDFMRRIRLPAQPSDISQLPTLSMPRSSEKYSWHLTDGVQTVDVAHQPKLVTADMFALREAACQGSGLALLPFILCRDQLQSGQLVRVLKEWRSPPSEIYIAFTSRKGMAPSVRAFIEFLDRHRARIDQKEAMDEQHAGVNGPALA